MANDIEKRIIKRKDKEKGLVKVYVETSADQVIFNPGESGLKADTVQKALLEIKTQADQAGVTGIYFPEGTAHTTDKDAAQGNVAISPTTIGAAKASDLTIVEGKIDQEIIDRGELEKTVAKNSQDIAANLEKIGQNTTAISTNTENIGKNTTAIGTNAENISKNAAAIKVNEGKIATNTTDITSIKTQLSQNTSSYTFANYTELESKLTNNTNPTINYKVGDNLFTMPAVEPDYWIAAIDPTEQPADTTKVGKYYIARIQADTYGIAELNTKVTEQGKSIAKNTEDIGKNNTAIGKNTTAIGNNTTAIGKNTDAIAALNKKLYGTAVEEQVAVKKAYGDENGAQITATYATKDALKGVKDTADAAATKTALAEVKATADAAATQDALDNVVNGITPVAKAMEASKLTETTIAITGDATGSYSGALSKTDTANISIALADKHSLGEKQVYSSCPVIDTKGLVVGFKDAIQFGETVGAQPTASLMIGGLFFELEA